MTTNKFLTFMGNARQLVTAIAASAGAADANKIVATGGDGRLSLSLMPTGVGASTDTIAASENLAAGDFVNVFNNAGTRNVRKADAANGRPANGFVLSAVASGQNATVYQQGVNTALSGLTPGVSMFLSATTAGGATANAPTTAGQIIQELGYALSTTSILFEYDAPTTIG